MLAMLRSASCSRSLCHQALGALALAGALGLAACARAPQVAAAHGQTFFADAQRQGFSLEDPMALNRAILEDVDRYGRSYGPPDERLRYLVRYLNFHYATNETLPARTSFYSRRGDCMTFALLVAPLARHLG